MLLSLLNIACAQVIFMAVAWRMLLTERSHPSIACRVRWTLWTGWHTLVGVGAFAVIISPLYGPLTAPRAHEVLTNVGLAIYFIMRWQRRSDDAAQPGVPMR